MKMINRAVICLCIIVLISGMVIFTGTYAVTLEEVQLEKVNEYLEGIKNSSPVPGFSVVIVCGDKIILKKGYGIETVGESAPMTENSSTAIGSFTKSFTVMAVMQLAEQGKLKLDDPVIKYIPWFRTADEDQSRKITIRMLLSNTSGIPSVDNWINDFEPSDEAMEKGIRALSSYVLNRKPGEAFEYSNEGFDTAGLVIEKVSGMKYKDYIQRNILTPLEMDRSTTDFTRFGELKVLYGHKLGIDRAIPSQPYLLTAALAAGSEFRSSSENLGHYLVALLNGGMYKGKKIISDKSLQEMWTPHASTPGIPADLGGDGKDGSYGLGWMIKEVEGRKLVFHGGNTITASSFNMVYPERKLAVSVLMNATAVDPYRYTPITTISNNILHILCNEPTTKAFIPTRKNPAETGYELQENLKQRYVGEYVAKNGDMKMKVSIGKNGRLEADGKIIMGTMNFEIKFVNDSVCYLTNMEGSTEGRFQITQSGQVAGLNFMGYSFFKQDNDAYAGYKSINMGDEKIKLKIPAEYDIDWKGNVFELHSKNDKDIKVTGMWIKGNIQLDNVAAEHLAAGEKIIAEGEEQAETISSFGWKEKSYIVDNHGIMRQKFVAITRIQNETLYLVLDAKQEEITRLVRDLMLPVMGSIEIQ